MQRDEARAAVLDHLLRRGVGGAAGVTILDAKTIGKTYGWAFFYNSRRYVETGEMKHVLVGQGPVVVFADTGEIVELGSAYPAEKAIQLLEESRGLP
jgi:hypothetical protein